MPTGGIGTYVLHIVRVLVKFGHKVSVISANAKFGDEVIIKDGYINYVTYAENHLEFREKALLVFDKHLDPRFVDLIESPEVGACALEIKLKYPDIPLLVRLHTPGVLITKFARYYQPLSVKMRYVFGALRRGRLDFGYWNISDRNRELDKEYQICILADQLVSPTIALKLAIIKTWKIPNGKIQIIPNPYLSDRDLTISDITNRKKVICFVGKLSVLKGMYSFTKALKQVLLNNPEYSAVIIGNDDQNAEYTFTISEWMKSYLEKVNERVNFLGRLNFEEIKNYLKSSSIFILPSLWENYPMVLLEAMSAGCPVVATSCGGVPEIIDHKINGLLIKPTKVRDIVNKIELLINNESIRVSIAYKGRDWVSKKENNLEINLKIFYSKIVIHYRNGNSSFL
jgi:glycogen(starch) synthase